MVGIYKITSPTGKVYIGQSWNIEDRFRRYKTLKCQRQVKIYSSLVKHGVINHEFEIIHELPNDVDQSVMNEYEKLYIKRYSECGVDLLNLQSGGHNGKHSEETKNKIRVANTGKVFTPERLKRMSEGNKGKPSPNKGKSMSKESKLKISEARKKCKMSAATKIKISNKLKGRIFSTEQRLKISNALMGRKMSPEHIAKTRRKCRKQFA